jgi:hypothetical protein
VLPSGAVIALERFEIATAGHQRITRIVDG